MAWGRPYVSWSSMAGQLLLGGLLQQQAGLKQSQLVGPLQGPDQGVRLGAALLGLSAVPLQQGDRPAQNALGLLDCPAQVRLGAVREAGPQPLLRLPRGHGGEGELLTPGAHRLEHPAAVLRQQQEGGVGRALLQQLEHGVQADIHPGFVKKVKEFISYMRPKLQEYHDIFTDNVIVRQRLTGTGILSREDAVSFGTTGGTGRASGWACDVRKRHPYAMYGKVDFKEIVLENGDCFDRYMVRVKEIEESMNIIEQLIDNIPEGEFLTRTKPVIKLPEGSWYSAVEGSRGEFGVYIESRGDKSPYRMKFRSTGLPLVSCIETISKEAKIADLIAIGGTLDYVVPDIDR